jgi:very-short-patch-repair endonuclease
MPDRPRPDDVLARLGHTATAADLMALCGRPQLRRAVADRRIVRVARGHYALPDLPDPRLTAARLRGVVSHVSAARLLGLDVVAPDRATHVTVPVHRNRRRTEAVTHWIDLRPRDIVDGVTSPLRTTLDCARVLSFAQALAVADSALRLHLVRPIELLTSAAGLVGAGRRRVLRVAQAADGRSASGLESVLRATMLQARIRSFTPQVSIADDSFSARVDLGDLLHRIALEADSFEHHGYRAALVRDCARYDELVVRGWLVLRFAWEQVMYQPEWVEEMVLGALRLRSPLARPTGLTHPRALRSVR